MSFDNLSDEELARRLQDELNAEVLGSTQLDQKQYEADLALAKKLFEEEEKMKGTSKSGYFSVFHISQNFKICPK